MHLQSAQNNVSDEICYLSPRGHYYVAKGELDTGFARHAQFITRYQANSSGKALSQLELAKRAIGA